MIRRVLPSVAVLALATLPALAWAAGPTISDAWARATPPGLDVGAAYLTITGGSAADRLVGVSTPVAAMAHLHTMDDTGGMATMRPVDGIDVRPGAQVVLAPGGLHVMLMGLTKALVAGQAFPLTLEFAKAGKQTVSVAIRPAGDTGPAAPAQH
jgi:copper(I)-binding protein